MWKASALCAASLLVAGQVQAQRGQSPVVPSSTIGPVTDAPTISVLGLTTLPDNGQPADRNELWVGATQPLGSLGGVRFAAIGNGNWRVRDAVSSAAAYEGVVALRARARLGDVRAWSAISYGHVDVSGGVAGSLVPRSIPSLTSGYDGTRADTTVSSRVDVGNIGRAEVGLLTNVSGVEFSFGLSVERATRVTTQTLTIDVKDGLPAAGGSSPRSNISSTRTMRALQRRDVATGIAAMGFSTGSTAWLVSVTSPVASWITSDDLAPKPRSAPAIASMAVVQPLATWLAVVGAASTNSSSVGSTVLRDDASSHRGSFAPVVALGLRISRLPFGSRGDETPHGILAFETRMIGSVDSATVMHTDSSMEADQAGDTLRVLLLIDAPKAESVEIMGDATQWVVTQMQHIRNGRWRAELKLSPGLHRVTVRSDGGKWIAPPGLPVGNDDYGSPVGVIVVRGKP